MDKDKVVESMRKKGYNAKNIGGVIQFFYPDAVTDYLGYVGLVIKELKEIGYEGSWGCRYSKEESKISQEETGENIEEEEE